MGAINKVIQGVNDLQTLYPEIAAEWNYELNGNKTPDSVAAHSNKKFWWHCHKCGYDWEASPNSRTSGSNCPACSNKTVVKGFNDLATRNPEIAKEWNYEKNGDITPEMVVSGCNKSFWWKCHECGFEWFCSINNRSSGRGCRKCGRKRAAEKFVKAYAKRNNFAENYPDIASEWNYSKNTEY